MLQVAIVDRDLLPVSGIESSSYSEVCLPGGGRTIHTMGTLREHSGVTSGKAPAFSETTAAGMLAMWWKVHLETPFSDRSSRSEHGSGGFAKPSSSRRRNWPKRQACRARRSACWSAARGNALNPTPCARWRTHWAFPRTSAPPSWRRPGRKRGPSRGWSGPFEERLAAAGYPTPRHASWSARRLPIDLGSRHGGKECPEHRTRRP